MRWLWLALAVWGAVHPMYYFVQWFRAEGLSIMNMVDAWHDALGLQDAEGSGGEQRSQGLAGAHWSPPRERIRA